MSLTRELFEVIDCDQCVSLRVGASSAFPLVCVEIEAWEVDSQGTRVTHRMEVDIHDARALRRALDRSVRAAERNREA